MVKGVIDFLTNGDKLYGIVYNAYISAFRTVLSNIATQNTQLAQQFEEDEQLDVIYNVG